MTLTEKIGKYAEWQKTIVTRANAAMGKKAEFQNKISTQFKDELTEIESELAAVKGETEKYKAEFKMDFGITDGEERTVLDYVKLVLDVVEKLKPEILSEAEKTAVAVAQTTMNGVKGQ